MGKPPAFEVVVEWSRWTVGIAWRYNKCLSGQYTLEVSVQVPVIALSYYKEHNGA